MSKLPAIHLYPGDWLRDPVAGCSLEAQGLWLRMMFIMHDSERYGYLVINGSPIPPGSIARRCGCTPEQYDALLAELQAAGVPSTTDTDVIYSRRMVRDAKDRDASKVRVEKHRMKRSCNADVTPNEDESESETAKALKQALKEQKFQLPVWVPEKAWLAYLQMRHKKGVDPTEHAKKLVCKKLEKYMNEGQSSEEILYQSVRCNWTDVWPIGGEGGTGKNQQAGRQSAGQARTERNRSILTEVLRERHGDRTVDGPDMPADDDGSEFRGVGSVLVRGVEGVPGKRD